MTEGFKVLDIFNISQGLLVVVAYPEKSRLKIDSTVKREAGGSWKIIGIGHSRLSSLTNGYKFFDPEVIVGGLLLKPIESVEIRKDDVLFIDES